jgi:hypothetical protein
MCVRVVVQNRKKQVLNNSTNKIKQRERERELHAENDKKYIDKNLYGGGCVDADDRCVCVCVWGEMMCDIGVIMSVVERMGSLCVYNVYA